MSVAAARSAIATITPESGRYQFGFVEEFTRLYARSLGVSDEQVRIFAGSSEPLHYTVMTFTSPKASYVTADPGYEA